MALQRVNARFLLNLTQRVMSKGMHSEEVQQLDVAVTNFRNSVRDVLLPVVMNDLEWVEQTKSPLKVPWFCLAGTSVDARGPVLHGHLYWREMRSQQESIRQPPSSEYFRFRLEALDAPELDDVVEYRDARNRCSYRSCLGYKALRLVRRLLDEATEARILVRLDSAGLPVRGAHGRIVCRLECCIGGDWTDVGQRLITEGLVFLYPIFGLREAYVESARYAVDRRSGLVLYP
eukprot:gene10480-11578_t